MYDYNAPHVPVTYPYRCGSYEEGPAPGGIILADEHWYDNDHVPVGRRERYEFG